MGLSSAETVVIPGQSVRGARYPTQNARTLLGMWADNQHGGPGRTRPCNQTVMSGKGDPEKPENIDE
jgi:hypothetical protein